MLEFLRSTVLPLLGYLHDKDISLFRTFLLVPEILKFINAYHFIHIYLSSIDTWVFPFDVRIREVLRTVEASSKVSYTQSMVVEGSFLPLL